MKELYDRMSVILAECDYGVWLDNTTNDPSELLPLLEPYPADEMAIREVSTYVNNVRHDDARCVE